MLAQRCTQAAREVKLLINTSASSVENGSARVLAAGETMREIVASVRQVSDLVKQIFATTDEQSRGIVQANAAIAQLDQMTQQNAALVEERAAAAASLDQQVQRLNNVVGVFRPREMQAA